MEPYECPEDREGGFHDRMNPYGIDECPTCKGVAIDDTLGTRIVAPDNATDPEANAFTAEGIRRL
jgi:Zn-finger nucleic acid-binding protein